MPGFNPFSCFGCHNICFLPQYSSVLRAWLWMRFLSLSYRFIFEVLKIDPPLATSACYNVLAISMEARCAEITNGRFFHLSPLFLSLTPSLFSTPPLLTPYTHTHTRTHHTPARDLKTSSLEKQSGLIYGWGGEKLLSLNCIWTQCSSVMFQYGANRVEVCKMMLISHQYHCPGNFSTLCCALVENVC